MNRLVELTEARTKTEAVRMAVEEEIRRRRLAEVLELVGTLEFDLTADELRHGDHRLG